MRSETMYKILVATLFVLFMVVGIYIGLEISDNQTDEKPQAPVSNTETIQIYEENANIINFDEQLEDVVVRFTDIYPECGHNIDTEEKQPNTTKKQVRKEIEEKDLGYRLIGEQDGVLIYQKVHTGICINHYRVMLENGVVVIYRMSYTGEYRPYQITDISENMLRNGIKEQLEKGIDVDDMEELFMLMEDIES